MATSKLSMCSNAVILAWLSLAALPTSASASTGEDLMGRLDLHAFLSQTALYSNDNNFFGNSDDSTSFDSNEVGAVLSARITDNLTLSTQLLSRNAGKGDTGDPRVDYAFINYRFYNSLDANYAVRIGKLRLPYGLYNDTRDVASTNPSILLPQSIYIDAGRNTFFAANGILLQGEHTGDNDAWRWETGAVQNTTDNNEISDLSGVNATQKDGGGKNLIGRIMYTGEFEKYRIGLSYREHSLLFTPHFAAYPLAFPGMVVPITGTDSTVKTESWVLSGQYNFDRFGLTSEYSVADITLNSLGQRSQFRSESYYVQGQYFLAPTVTLLARTDFFYKDHNDRNGDEFVSSLNAPITLPFLGSATTSLQRNAHSQYAKDVTLGITWAAMKNLQLRAELHNIEGTGWLSAADNTNAINTSKHWNLFMLQAAYRF